MDIRTVGRRRRRLALSVALLTSAAFAARARADSCSDCGPPSDAEFRAAMGDAFRDFGDYPDSYEYDGGECSAVVGPVTTRKVREDLVSMGVGEAWSCPENKSSSHTTFSFQMSAETEWHLTASVSTELDAAILAAMKLGVEGGTGGGIGSSTTTTIAVNIESAFCHRTPWAAYFVVGEFEARAHFDVKRRFRWWIKNVTSGARVVASGDVYVVCDGGEAVMARIWPILGSVLAGDRRCATGCANVAVGTKVWHPALPPGVPPIDPWPLGPDEPSGGGGSGGGSAGGEGGGGDGGGGTDGGTGPDAPVPPAPTAPPEKPVDPKDPPPPPPTVPVTPLTPGAAGAPDLPTTPLEPPRPGGDEPKPATGSETPGAEGDPWGPDDPWWPSDDPEGDDPYGGLNPIDGTPTCPVGPDGRHL